MLTGEVILPGLGSSGGQYIILACLAITLHLLQHSAGGVYGTVSSEVTDVSVVLDVAAIPNINIELVTVDTPVTCLE